MYAKVSMLISLIPYLSSNEGHGYIYHYHFAKALPKGFEHKAYIPFHAKLETTPENWERVFNKTPKNRLFKLLARTFDFCSIFRKRSSKLKRIFFLESFNTIDLLSLYIATKLFSKRTDAFWLVIRNECKRRSYRFLIKKLTHARKCTFFTDNELLQKICRDALEQKVHELPVLPLSKSQLTQSTAPYTIKKPLLLWIGEPREEKGLISIVQLLKSTEPEKNQFEFALTHHPAFDIFAGSFHPIQRSSRIDVFYSYLQAATVVLLPYEPSVYRNITSGIFVEAIAVGKIPLVKEGTYLAYELKKFDLEELIVDWGASDFFTQLQSLTRNPLLRKKLDRMQATYLERYSLLNLSCTLKQHLENT